MLSCSLLRASLAGLAAAALIAVVAMACEEVPTGPGRPARLSIVNAPDTMEIGDTLRLRVAAWDARGKRIEKVAALWGSSDSLTVFVSRYGGVVHAIDSGSVAITATSGSLSATVRITSIQTVRAIRVSVTNDSLILGDSTKAVATLLDGVGRIMSPAPVRWYASDSTILRVDSTGRIRSVGAGEASAVAVLGRGIGHVPVRVSLHRVPFDEPFTALTGGDRYACGLTASGSAYCWGLDQFGALGGGIITGATSRPRLVVGGHVFVQIDAGQWHTCARAATGEAYCWGSNHRGELGQESTSPAASSTPLRVTGGLRFSHVAVNMHHATCAVAETVPYCWGHNDRIQVGRPPASNYDLSVAPVPGGVHMHFVDGGPFHTCGLALTGEAYCWGQNWSGEGGVSTVETLLSSPQPVEGSYRFARLALGAAHTCGLDFSGTAYCWGANHDGQLGRGSADDNKNPRPAPVVGELRFKEIGLSTNASCALTADGAVYCWGSNLWGELGNLWMPMAAAPVRVAPGQLFKTLAVGARHACAVGMDDRVYCWGKVPSTMP